VDLERWLAVKLTKKRFGLESVQTNMDVAQRVSPQDAAGRTEHATVERGVGSGNSRTIERVSRKYGAEGKEATGQ
jgi:hypothetical protein